MSFFSFSKSQSDKLVLAIGIDSGTVWGALIYLKKEGKPKVLYEAREQIPFRENLNQGRLFAGALRSLNHLLEKIEKEGILHLNFTGLARRPINKVAYVLSSPWHISGTRVASLAHSEPFTTTDELLEEIADKEEKDFLENSLLEEKEINRKNNFEFMERRVLRTTLNGYETTDPEGKEVTEFEAVFLFSFSPLFVVNSLRKAIFKHFHEAEVEFHSFTCVSFAIARDLFPTEDDFLSVHISGEVTEISVIKRGIIIEALSFPLGRNFLIRKVMEKMPGSSPAVALSFLKLYTLGKADRDLSSKIEKITEQAEKDWINLFYSSLAGLSREFFLPKTVLIFAEEDYANIFTAFIKRQRFYKPDEKEKTFEVALIDREKLKFLYDSGTSLEKNSFAAVLSVFLMKVHSQ